MSIAPQLVNGLAIDREPWARQPRETEKAWAAFQRFLVQTPPRNVVRLAAETDKPLQALYAWSSRFTWTQRAIAYDGMLQRARDEELIEARREMNRRHANLAKAMSAKIAQRLQALSAEELSPGELGRWMQVVSMVERLALGEATEIRQGQDVQVSVGVQVNNEIPDVATASVEHIAEVLDRLAARGIVPLPVVIEGTVIEVGEDTGEDAVRASREAEPVRSKDPVGKGRSSGRPPRSPAGPDARDPIEAVFGAAAAEAARRQRP